MYDDFYEETMEMRRQAAILQGYDDPDEYARFLTRSDMIDDSDAVKLRWKLDHDRRTEFERIRDLKRRLREMERKGWHILGNFRPDSWGKAWTEMD